jgi:DNA-binding IclR family transcriptional regulator
MSGVQSIERAFAILRCLAGGPAGVSEVAERVDLPKSTVSRLLSTLQDVGAVEQPRGGNEYRIGPGMIELASGALPGRHLIAAARPHLLALVELLGEAAGLAVLDDRDVVYLDQVDADNAVLVRNWTGERVPAHTTSSGLVLLASRPEDEWERYLAGPLVALTDRTMTDRAALRRRLTEVRRRGWAWTRDEGVDGISSIAAPIAAGSGQALAAVHAHGPSYRFPGAGSAEEIATRVVLAARRIGAPLVDALAG